MDKKTSKIISYLPQIIALLFVAGFAVYAWTEPTSAPPGGNVAAPLNAGPTGQSKEGGLILNTGNATTGLIIDKGKLCLGTNCIGSWSEIVGAIITYRMAVSSYSVGSSYYGSKTASYTCPSGSTPAITYCKSIIMSGTSINACSCSGSTLKAYVQRNRRCESWPETQITAVDSCQSYSTASCDTNCISQGPCEIEFQCGKKETVGTYSLENCQADNIALSGGTCNQSADDSECNTRCTSAGWGRGSRVSCSPNWRTSSSWGVSYNYQCGLTYQIFDFYPGGSERKVSCQCSN